MFREHTEIVTTTSPQMCTELVKLKSGVNSSASSTQDINVKHGRKSFSPKSVRSIRKSKYVTKNKR